MVSDRGRAYPVMILYAVGLHTAWGVLGLYNPSAYLGTAPAAVYRIFGDIGTPIACFSVAGLAFVGTEFPDRLLGLMMMLPQQCLLVISAVGVFSAIVVGHFADGVIRSRAFIISDQIPAILAAVGHTWAIVQWFWLRHQD